ncbi:NAD(P)-binding protein [Nemania abortiva]|nr:NAD(P)-binding protein [Nemania abortiva]
MPSRRLALVTGANGFIAAQTVARFLGAGWAVRGTVRDLNSRSTRDLAAHFAPETALGTFELVAVPDIKVPGAFDDAVRGAHAIAHLATPVVFDSGDVNYIIGTAVHGTLSVLESALRAGGAGLGSFVLMSSVAAMRTRAAPPAILTERDWNTHSEEEVKEAGDKAFGHLIYAASKAASERAFWGWIRERQPSFAATALCPVWVAGPPAYPPSSPDGIAETNSSIWKVFSGQEFPEGPAGYGAHVDVRDVARMTEWAASHPEIAGGERYLVGGGGNVGAPQAVADILRKAYPDRRGIIKEGRPGEGYRPGYTVDPRGIYASSTKATNATGQGWIPYERIILDAAKSFEVLL